MAWLPFTSEGKEAIAHYDEIPKEIKLAVHDCGRKLQAYLKRRKKQRYETDRRSIFTRYIGELVNSCNEISRVNKEKLTADLMAIAKRVTARADEKVELISAGGKGKAGKDLPGSEYGENTIVVEQNAEAAPGPLFKK